MTSLPDAAGGPVARCLIPAAGRGSRMRPVTVTVPKELLPVGTRPVLQWCLTEALEGGFREIAVVTGGGKPLLEKYLRDGLWREGILPAVRSAAEGMEIELFRQARPLGVVDAILAARAWVESGHPFAVFLPDNVRIAGGPPLTSDHVRQAAADGRPLVACHRVGPEARHFFGNVGRAELEDLVPAGRWPRVAALQERGAGAFRASPEGAWRLMPRYVVTSAWTEVARDVAVAAAVAGVEADDVEVHRRLAAAGRLAAVPWQGTMVDAGHPAGYLYAQHLLHEAGVHERDAENEAGRAGSGLLEIEA